MRTNALCNKTIIFINEHVMNVYMVEPQHTHMTFSVALVTYSR